MQAFINFESELTSCQELMREHQLILAMIEQLQLLSSVSEHIEESKFFDLTTGAIKFIREFADDYHHAKEEDVLFEALVKPGVLQHCNPIEQMLHEHEMGRNAVALMKKGLDMRSISLVCEGMNNYCHLLSQHIFKEDKILYPMAEKSLEQSTIAELLEKMSKVEVAKNKTQLWEDSVKLLNDLKECVESASSPV